MSGPEQPPDQGFEFEFDTLMPDWVGWTIAGVLFTMTTLVAMVAIVTML